MSSFWAGVVLPIPERLVTELLASSSSSVNRTYQIDFESEVGDQILTQYSSNVYFANLGLTAPREAKEKYT